MTPLKTPTTLYIEFLERMLTSYAHVPKEKLLNLAFDSGYDSGLDTAKENQRLLDEANKPEWFGVDAATYDFDMRHNGMPFNYYQVGEPFVGKGTIIVDQDGKIISVYGGELSPFTLPARPKAGTQDQAP